MQAGLTNTQVFKAHLLIWCFALCIAILSSSTISTARLMPSATYCLVSLLELQSGLIFYIPGIGVIGIFLIHRYASIYFYLKQSSCNLIQVSAQRKAQQRQVWAAKKMFAFVLAFFICGGPILIVSIVEISVGIIAPAWLHLVAGHLVHLNSLLNPILYVWMNKNSRAAFWKHAYSLLGKTYDQKDHSVVISSLEGTHVVIEKSNITDNKYMITHPITITSSKIISPGQTLGTSTLIITEKQSFK